MTLRELRQRRGAWWLVLGLGAGLSFLRIACSVLGLSEMRYNDDEVRYYLPAVRQMAERWPSLDLSGDALSAVSPGYLYMLAGLGRWAGLDSTTLRLFNWAVAVGVLIVLLRLIFPRCPPWRAAILLLPFCVSSYFLKSSAWLVTDNAGLLLTLAALSAALRPTASIGSSLASGMLAGVSVFARQAQAWVALPVALASGWQAWTEGRRARALLLAALALLPAVGVLALLIASWGGLVPPGWTKKAVAVSTSGPIYFVAVLGCFGPIFWLSSRDPQDSLKESWRWLALAGLAAVVLWLSGPSTMSGEGRWGGYLWSLASSLPQVGERAISFLLLDLLGAFSVALIARSLWLRGEYQWLAVLGAALLAFTVSFLPNRNAFHRYFEPPALIFLALACAPLARHRFRGFPLLLLAVVQLGWSITLLFLVPLGY